LSASETGATHSTAYDAATWETLWQTPVGTGIVAAPMTWERDGTQYVTVAAGWRGVYGITQKHTETPEPGRVLTFKLGGTAEMPETTLDERELVAGVPYDPEHYGEGAALYIANCVFCHGVPAVDSGGNVPNLGYSDAATLEDLENILHSAAFADRGMPSFEGKLSAEEVARITAFIHGTVDAVRPR
jgi:mono/diheme cytochrome c family protein